MGFEWFNNIDRIVWDLEEYIQSSAREQSVKLGVAPSAADEARKRLRANASSDQSELSEDEVKEASMGLAEAASKHAADRGSRHVTREDVAAAIDDGGFYPYSSK